MHRTVLQYLDDIFEAISNIEDDTTGISFEEFVADRRRKDAVIRNFEVIGEAAKKLSPDFRNRYPAVAWKQIAGMRDVIAHRYFHVDYEVIWGIITRTVPGFKTAIVKIRKEEQRRERESRK